MKLNVLLAVTIAGISLAIWASNLALALPTTGSVGHPVVNPFETVPFSSSECPSLSGVYKRPDNSNPQGFSYVRFTSQPTAQGLVVEVGLPMTVTVDGSLHDLQDDKGVRVRYQAFCAHKQLRIQVLRGEDYIGFLAVTETSWGQLAYVLNMKDGDKTVFQAYQVTKFKDI